MVSEEKPGQIESAALGAAAVFPVQAFKTWINAYFRPAAAIKASPASLGAAVKNLAFAGFLAGVVSGIAALVSMSIGGAAAGSAARGALGGMMGGSVGFAGGIVALVVMAIVFPVLYVICGLVGSAVYFVVAKILGGKGSYTLQTNIFALVMCGAALLGLPFQLLGAIPMVGGIFSLATMVISLYALYSYYRAIKGVHQLSQMRAIAVLVLPMIVLGVLAVVLLGAMVLAFLGAAGMAAAY